MTKIESSENFYKDEGVWVETPFGIFRPAAPKYDIRDIAYALARNCRFNGHVSHFYSVGAHSLNVAHLMQLWGGDPLEGLLHDGTEAYLSDVPSPFKSLIPDWRKLDKFMETELRKQFGLPETKSELCAKADWYALFIEANWLMPSHGEKYEDPYKFRAPAIALAEADTSFQPRLYTAFAAVEQEFLAAFNKWKHS